MGHRNPNSYKDPSLPFQVGFLLIFKNSVKIIKNSIFVIFVIIDAGIYQM